MNTHGKAVSEEVHKKIRVEAGGVIWGRGVYRITSDVERDKEWRVMGKGE